MIVKKLFQSMALLCSVALVGAYVYFNSPGTSDPRPRLQQVERTAEIMPAEEPEQAPVPSPNFAEPGNFIGSTKSFIVFPPSSTSPWGSPPQFAVGIDQDQIKPAAGPTFTSDLFLSSSKSGMIFDPKVVAPQSSPPTPAPLKSESSKSGWVPYVPPELPPNNQSRIRK